jgi:hypothetical protein
MPDDAFPAGYGADPDLKHPVLPWPLLMEPHQLQQTALLADLILPASASAPAPSAIGVPEFINEWVSAPYPDQVLDRAILLEGLNGLDAQALRLDGRDFVELSPERQLAIVKDLAQRKAPPTFTGAPRFFERLRFLVVGGYYTTPEGFKDIGYIGNVPLASYPPITGEERKILDDALATLGFQV